MSTGRKVYTYTSDIQDTAPPSRLMYRGKVLVDKLRVSRIEDGSMSDMEEL